ncbi:hypothetical protein DAEQUDRAFT_763019 [Daedalea quercina L-15889]|uniref:Uncharacterized protein n=1 Tax=Daedalea quercina L-15889 TaxID=1314783 RepID=A0A165SNZ6_9APHY|nr:hypothetical protein DAEQUDRAFT_763019 [Daedalea quercina L-15889]
MGIFDFLSGVGNGIKNAVGSVVQVSPSDILKLSSVIGKVIPGVGPLLQSAAEATTSATSNSAQDTPVPDGVAGNGR